MKVKYHVESYGHYPENFIGARDKHAIIDKEEWCCKKGEENLFVYSVQNVYDLCFFFGRSKKEFPFSSYEMLTECPYCHETINAVYEDVPVERVTRARKTRRKKRE